jgi:cell division septal protein FtsQ
MSKTRKRIQERRQKKRQRNILIAVLVGGLLLITSGVFLGKNAWENRGNPSLIEVSGQPSLKVDQQLIDYGDVKLDTNLTFALELTNIGDQPLRISEPPYVEVVEGC